MQPGWIRAVMIRRGAALALVMTALVLTVVEHRSAGAHSVVVAAHDLMPGHRVTATDLRVQEVPRELIPTGTLRMRADAVGRLATGRIRAGEIVTDTRLLSPQLPAQLSGLSDARLVPVHLADQTTADLLREGDVVDVLAATTAADEPGATHRPAVLARDAVVALTSGEPSTNSLTTSRSAPRPVLLAMAEAAAHRVASAGLDASLAVVVH